MTDVLLKSAFVGVLTAMAATAQAAPIYVGLQDGGGAITTIIAAANGSTTFGLTQIGNSGVAVSGNVSGTPPQNEPTLLSNTVTLSGEHDGGGTVSVYVSELNLNPLNYRDFVSRFTNAFNPLSSLGAGNQTANTATRVVESTYVTSCALLGLTAQGACQASDAYAEGTLLSTTTFTQGGFTSVVDSATAAALTAPYVVTEVYNVTFAAPSGVNTYGGITASIDMSVPEPRSLTVLAIGLLGLTMAAYTRRRA